MGGGNFFFFVMGSSPKTLLRSVLTEPSLWLCEKSGFKTVNDVIFIAWLASVRHKK